MIRVKVREKVRDREIGGVTERIDKKAGFGDVFGGREIGWNRRKSEETGRGGLGGEEELG